MLQKMTRNVKRSWKQSTKYQPYFIGLIDRPNEIQVKHIMLFHKFTLLTKLLVSHVSHLNVMLIRFFPQLHFRF